MIKKPADAVPHTAHLFTDTGNMVPVYVKAFTAAECAEIAKAYGHACIHSFIDTEDEKVRKFEALFAEWECK
jgi:hypothetical protein